MATEKRNCKYSSKECSHTERFQRRLEGPSPEVVDITLIKKLRALGHREKGRVSLEWKDWFSSGSFHGKMGNTAQSIWKIWGE